MTFIGRQINVSLSLFSTQSHCHSSVQEAASSRQAPRISQAEQAPPSPKLASSVSWL